jgi:hypothetical protein
MKRLLILSSMAVWLISCANSGNGNQQTETSGGETINTEPTNRSSNPMDTVNVGVGAGVNTGSDERSNNGAGTGTGTGTGAASAGGSSTGVNAGTGGAGTSGNDTSRTRRQ